eukprot:TRINITY_DN16298_c0_g1_i1.p1 TRINITY_DN16298_c0_g1~~TRINITY_DN16298_c0_g1_i1.p1  ORF type:complete len:456 (+),score=114.60 TRINITY_DN16298_c0_g1_i1:87-1454(+)
MEKQLAGVFASFCAFGSGGHAKAELDNAKFAKMCRDTGILDRHFTPTDADLIFSKAKPRGGRTIDFHVFRQQVVSEIARRKRIPEPAVVEMLCGGGGPASSGTVAESVALHDDRGTYTGVYKHGGPSTTDLDTADLYFIANRQEADVRGVVSPHHQPSVRTPRTRSRSGSRSRAVADAMAASASDVQHTPQRGEPDPLLQQLGGAREIAAIVSTLQSLQARGVPLLGSAISRLHAAASSSSAQPHTHTAGQLSSYSPKPLSHDPSPPRDLGHHPARAIDPAAASPPRSGSMSRRSQSASGMRGEGARVLEELFNSFCAFGAGQRGSAEMDGAKFVKLCRDTCIIGRRFTTTDADLVFSKVKPKGGRTIGFSIFYRHALPEIAARKACSVEQLIQSMRGGPQSTGTIAEPVALHDDVDGYTGVYARGGPSSVDLQTSDLAYITNRAPADVRGIQQQ